MKRDMDLVRKILFKIEDAPFDGGPVEVIIEGIENEVTQYHLLLLSEAGLIDAMHNDSFGSGPEYIPTRLTWLGHEFIDSSRNENLWTKAKTTVLKKAGGLSFDVLLYVLKEYAKQAIID